MKLSLPALLPIFIFTFFLASSCKNDDDIIDPPEEEPITNIDLSPVEITADISLPSTIGNLENLSVVAGFYSGSVDLNAGDVAGKYSITLNDKNIQLVTLMNEEEPLAFTIAIPSNSNSLSIDAHSTAVALVYMNPFIVDSDPNSFEIIESFITSSPNFEDLKQAIEEKMTAGGLIIDDISDYLGEVTGDVQDRITNFLINAATGLDTLNVNDEVITFQLVNRRKRWLGVTANRFKNGTKEATIIYEGDAEFSNYELPSDRADFIVDFLLEEVSDELRIPLEDSDSVVLSCYGLGRNPPEIPSDEWEYGLDAIVNTLYFDFTIELFSVYSGIGNQIAIDLRGRPQKLKNIQRKIQDIFKSELIKNQFELREALSDEDFKEFLITCGGIIFDIVKDTENAKLFYDILKEFGIGKVLANNIIKKVLPALQIAEIANSAVNVGLFFYTVSTQEWQTDFNLNTFECIDKTHEGEVYLDTQTRVEEFAQMGYTRITGGLFLTSEFYADYDPITDLSSLSCLKEIDGALEIRFTNITTVDGLQNISEVGTYFIVEDNNQLINLDAFSNIKGFGKICSIFRNAELENVEGLYNFEYLGDFGLSIGRSPKITAINGFNKITGDGSAISIGNMDNLVSIVGFNGVTNANLNFSNNPKLQTIDGFDNFNSTDINARVDISKNDILQRVDGFPNYSIGRLTILDNPNLERLYAFSRLEEISSITFKNNDKVKNFDDLGALKEIRSITIQDNDQLESFCAFVYPAQNYFIDQFSYFVYDNLYNPTLDDLKQGICE